MTMTDMEENGGRSRPLELVPEGAADVTSQTIIADIHKKLNAAQQSFWELRGMGRFELSARVWSDLKSRTDDSRWMVNSLVPSLVPK